MSAQARPHFTPAQYLELERAATYRSQLVDGEVFAMAGASQWHVRIVTNLTGELHNRFKGRSCQVFTTDLRLRVPDTELWTYPDVMALCGEPKLDDEKFDTLLNPQVIFEVLSPSTEGFDRGKKFARYRRLASLTDYVLVAQDEMRVEHYVRQTDNTWRLQEFTAGEQAVPLASLGCELPLADIYDRVVFPPPGPFVPPDDRTGGGV